MTHRIERTFAGRSFSLETGRMAKQAAGSALVQFGDTMVLAAVTVSDKESSLPFFPLTVEYKEKAYAAGKIPGGFIKREGRPRDEEILACRIIDRSIRPLFPEGFKNEVQVFVYVLSADRENDADVLGLVATSFALNASRIPFAGLIGSVRVGRVQGKWVLNPTFEQLEYSDTDIVVAGSRDSIMMVEGGALEISEDEMVEALTVGQKGIRELIGLQEDLLKKVTVSKMDWTRAPLPDGLADRVRALSEPRIREALNQKDKHGRVAAIEGVKAAVALELAAEYAEQMGHVKHVLDEVEYEQLRAQVLSTGRRVDGRKPTEVRDITIDTTVLPRVHGSALFTRGQTQALVATTLGTKDDVQRLDGIDDIGKDASKAFMLHYNFPPFSTGEVRPMRGTSRREIGHGNLAERALQGVLPPFDEFPYTIRIVSEVLESNGSSSMASVCGGSLACFDAGVPLKGAVAGVAMGLIKEGDDYAILTDILGTEDHLGDMDFKVAGTAHGITSIQMDIKIQGLSLDLMKEALAQANAGRMHILKEMDKALPAPRPDLSAYAPRIVTVQISPEKIGDLIGPKGKTIRGIQDETGASISVEDDGVVTIAAVGGESMERARQMVQALTAEPVVGEIYEGTVKSTTAFGAFVEIMPGTEALVHISELQHGRVEKTEDVIKKGDRVRVKLIERDERGRLRLSMKALMPKPESAAPAAPGDVEDGAEPVGVEAVTDGEDGGAPRERRGDRGGRRGGGGRGRR
jgi:polyribonucleotide nucleotidyltransferase